MPLERRIRKALKKLKKGRFLVVGRYSSNEILVEGDPEGYEFKHEARAIAILARDRTNREEQELTAKYGIYDKQGKVCDFIS